MTLAYDLARRDHCVGGMVIPFRAKNDDEFWDFVVAVTRPALLVAPTTFLSDIRAWAVKSGVAAAVIDHDSGTIFDFLIGVIQHQGISDKVAGG